MKAFRTVKIVKTNRKSIDHFSMLISSRTQPDENIRSRNNTKNTTWLFVVFLFDENCFHIYIYPQTTQCRARTVYRKIGTHSFDGIELNHFIWTIKFQPFARRNRSISGNWFGYVIQWEWMNGEKKKGTLTNSRKSIVAFCSSNFSTFSSICWWLKFQSTRIYSNTKNQLNGVFFSLLLIDIVASNWNQWAFSQVSLQQHHFEHVNADSVDDFVNLNFNRWRCHNNVSCDSVIPLFSFQDHLYIRFWCVVSFPFQLKNKIEKLIANVSL